MVPVEVLILKHTVHRAFDGAQWCRVISHMRNTIKKIQLLLISVGMVFSFKSAYPEDSQGLSKFFIQLLNADERGYKPEQYQIREKGGIKTLIQKDQYGSTWTYLFDRKNWFLGLNFTSDVSAVTGTAGMYFKPDGTPIVGVSLVTDKFGGPAQQWSEIIFEEFSCDITKGQTCAGRDVTAAIFPQLSPNDFVTADAESQAAFAARPGEKLVRYEIPRNGTNITASLWLNIANSEPTVLASDRKILRYTHCNIGWVKKLAKFEKGKCTKKIGDALYYGN